MSMLREIEHCNIAHNSNTIKSTQNVGLLIVHDKIQLHISNGVDATPIPTVIAESIFLSDADLLLLLLFILAVRGLQM